MKVSLSFKSIKDIYSFKHECHCSDFYIDSDALKLVGVITEEQLQLAKKKYAALNEPDLD